MHLHRTSRPAFPTSRFRRSVSHCQPRFRSFAVASTHRHVASASFRGSNARPSTPCDALVDGEMRCAQTSTVRRVPRPFPFVSGSFHVRKGTTSGSDPNMFRFKPETKGIEREKPCGSMDLEGVFSLGRCGWWWSTVRTTLDTKRTSKRGFARDVELARRECGGRRTAENVSSVVRHSSTPGRRIPHGQVSRRRHVSDGHVHPRDDDAYESRRVRLCKKQASRRILRFAPRHRRVPPRTKNKKKRRDSDVSVWLSSHLRPPGIEPGSPVWETDIITTRPRAHSASHALLQLI